MGKRKVVLEMVLSFDGFATSLDGTHDWMFEFFGDDSGEWNLRALDEAGTHAMGRRSYEIMGPHWLASEGPVDELSGLHDAAGKRTAVRRGLVASENVWIEVDIAGPTDGAELSVDFHCAKEAIVVADRGEYASGLEHRGKVDLVNRPVRERQPKPPIVERLDVRDGGAGRGHGSGSIGMGCPGSWR